MSGMNEIRRQIAGVVDALLNTYDRHGGTSHNLSGRPLPDRQVVGAILEGPPSHICLECIRILNDAIAEQRGGQ